MWPAQQTWEDHPIKGEQQRWRMVENLDEALHNRVQQTANLRLGMANTQTIYYSAMQRSLPDIAEQYMDTWHRTTGITGGMKNIRAKYLTGQLPTAKNLQRYKVKRTPICPCCKKHPDEWGTPRGSMVPFHTRHGSGQTQRSSSDHYPSNCGGGQRSSPDCL